MEKTMSDTRNMPKNEGQKNAEFKNLNQKTTNAMPEQGRNRANDTTRKEAKDSGQARQLSDIKPHMEVISSCGCTMGKVDHLEGNSIKLTKNDSPDGQHHFIPKDWVESVDNHVHLRKNAEETLQEWKPDAASCAS
jgi:hypothetical protein